MSGNDDHSHTTGSRLLFAQLKASLIQADLHERELHPHVGAWPAHIGFVIFPANDHLAKLREEEKDSGLPQRQQRIVDLIADLKMLFAGWRPTALDLEHAPIIIPDVVLDVQGAQGHSINVVGHVRHVPGGGPDRRRITSPIAAFDAQRFSWVRTLSRFYRVEQGAQYVSRN